MLCLLGLAYCTMIVLMHRFHPTPTLDEDELPPEQPVQRPAMPERRTSKPSVRPSLSREREPSVRVKELFMLDDDDSSSGSEDKAESLFVTRDDSYT